MGKEPSKRRDGSPGRGAHLKRGSVGRDKKGKAGSNPAFWVFKSCPEDSIS